ncbi:hypothetical protein [Agromyces sp. S2-1-8]|uniref:hypothetical protein n=1 Tax=Agromyces sp. S2-1-8 TaxID=2897180 RepID=UPI001E4644CE|nr:hypothetical protein [Agromyces sp. S2-1-8]MCD5348107.1 hypothetical protein [Agromyces sp. S2-1-8]
MGKSRDRRAPAPVDVHAEAIAHSLDVITQTISGLDPDRLVEGLDEQIRSAIARMVELMRGQSALEVIEQGRLWALPWHSGHPTYQAGIENGFSCVELIAIVAMKTAGSAATSTTQPAAVIEECLQIAEDLRHLASVRAVAAADEDDPLGWISATLQITEMSMRGSSYAELLEETTRALFGEESVDKHLRAAIGFGVSEAIVVLTSLNDLQTRNMNRRKEAALRKYENTRQNHEHGIANDDQLRDATRQLDLALQPDAVAASVSVADVTRATQLPAELVGAVFDRFTWAPSPVIDVEGAVRAFLTGDNPLRSKPIVRTDSGRALLIHPALTQVAIREGLEAAMRSTSGWEPYQAHRGSLLELRTRQAFERLLPSARAWHAFRYYVPADGAEKAMEPDHYTKRVEGDHLLIVDDVAIVIEDKAVALSAQSRSGTSFRLRKDLTGIITKAAEQADRLVQRIKEDGGVRIHGLGWIDLAGVREVHTVAVSLDDLTSTSTATAELVKAGLISVESVPWTVSIHDLDLIAELIRHPAEFLLYLRRRRHSEATVLYTATDELDLFLYFFEAGLYVEEDPELLRSTFTFLPAVGASERERWRQQIPGVITSRTDHLDAWYFEDHLRGRQGKTRLPSAPPKPRMTPTPLEPLIEGIDKQGTYGAYSIAASLLSGDARAQRRMARHGVDVSRASDGGSMERTITTPLLTLDDGGWILVWATCPAGRDREKWEVEKRKYLRAKGHQLGVARSALFAFDGATGEMFGAYYEAIPDELTESEQAVAARLQPATAMQSTEHVLKKLAGQRAQPRRRRKRR